MPNSSEIITEYELLMESICAINDIQQTNNSDTAKMVSVGNDIMEAVALLSEFQQAIPQIVTRLDNYDFNDGFQFGVFYRIIESLQSLLFKLDEMDKEAKELQTYPNLRDSRKVVEDSNDLIVRVKEKTNLDEIEKVTEIVEANTKKMISLCQQIDEDERKELRRILTLLNEGEPYMWDDVAEKYKKRIIDLLNGDLRSMAFDLELFNKEIENEKDNRENDIQKTLKKHPWLQKKRHKDFHDSLTARHMVFWQYQDYIDERVALRRTKIFIPCALLLFVFVVLMVNLI